MRRALALAITVLFIHQAQAGDKKTVVTPERVGQLLTILRSDLNEENRAMPPKSWGVSMAAATRRSSPVDRGLGPILPACAPRSSIARPRSTDHQGGRARIAKKTAVQVLARSHSSRTYHTAGYQEQEKKIAGSPTSRQRHNCLRPGWHAVQSGMPVSSRAAGWPIEEQAGPTLNRLPKRSAACHGFQSIGRMAVSHAAKPAAPKSGTQTEPPMAGSPEIVIRAATQARDPVDEGNPFADIPSAPQRSRPRRNVALHASGPVVPVLLSKPNDGGRSKVSLLTWPPALADLVDRRRPKGAFGRFHDRFQSVGCG